jgi:hypothetical protein
MCGLFYSPIMYTPCLLVCSWYQSSELIESPTIESTRSHFVMRFLFVCLGEQVVEAALISRTQRLEQMLMDVEPRVRVYTQMSSQIWS